jgi:hypothetical protein
MAITDGFSLLDRAVSNYLKGTQRRTVAGLAGESRANIKHVVPHTMIEAPRFMSHVPLRTSLLAF